MISRILVYVIITFGILLFIKGSNENSNKRFTTEYINDIVPGIYKQIADSIGFSETAFNFALNGLSFLLSNHVISNDSILSFIDYNKPSDQERFYVINLKRGTLINKSLVAHGKNSGIVAANKFSNQPHSFMSSLGLFITSDTYQGKHGYSLRLIGVDKGLNDNALSRNIVIHGASYVSEDFLRQNGRIGRSFGCPALPVSSANDIIDEIKNGTCLFIYHSSIESSWVSYHPGKSKLIASSSNL